MPGGGQLLAPIPGNNMGLLNWAARIFGLFTWSCMAAKDNKGGMGGGGGGGCC